MKIAHNNNNATINSAITIFVTIKYAPIAIAVIPLEATMRIFVTTS